MNDLQTITANLAKVAKETLPPSILQMGGRVLYSPVETLVSGSQVYFLGGNPGEVPGSTVYHNLLTIKQDIERLETHRIIDHALLDEAWKDYSKGMAPIQVRAQMVFSILAGGDGIALLRRTPTSNMVFVRSEDERQLEQSLGKKAGTIAELFWPFHQAIIKTTNPILVLTHAVGMARSIAEWLGLGAGKIHPSGHGGLKNCYAWRLPDGPMLLAIPSLSRYHPGGPRKLALQSFFSEFVPEIFGNS